MKTCFLIITDITVLQFLDKLAVLIDLCHIKRKAFALLIDYGDLDRLAALSIDIQVQRVELLEETGAQHVKDGQFAVLMLVQGKVVVEPQMVQFVTEVNAINQAFYIQRDPVFAFTDQIDILQHLIFRHVETLETGAAEFQHLLGILILLVPQNIL